LILAAVPFLTLTVLVAYLIITNEAIQNSQDEFGITSVSSCIVANSTSTSISLSFDVFEDLQDFDFNLNSFLVVSVFYPGELR